MFTPSENMAAMGTIGRIHPSLIKATSKFKFVELSLSRPLEKTRSCLT